MAKFTSKRKETHLEYMLPFSVVDVTPAYIRGHLMSPKNSVQTEFVNTRHNFSHQKNIY